MINAVGAKIQKAEWDQDVAAMGGSGQAWSLAWEAGSCGSERNSHPSAEESVCIAHRRRERGE